MTNSDITFSIIIPTLNEERFLPRLLNSLKKQKEKDFEVIVVDGGSTDKTIQKAKEYSKYFKRFKIVTSLHKNPAHQRNLGAKKAQGKFLVFLDADSKVTSSFLTKLKKAIEKKPGFIYLPKFIPDIKSADILLLFEIAFFLIEISQYTSKPFSPGGEIIIRKEIFELIGGFNKNLAMSEDHELIQRAKKYGITTRTLPEVKITFSLRRMQREGRLKFFLKYLYSSIQTLISGGIEKTIFEYEMGGHLYKKRRPSKKIWKNLIDNNLKKFKTLVQKTLKNLS